VDYTESHNAECRYAECHGGLITKAEIIIITLFSNAATVAVTFQVNFLFLGITTSAKVFRKKSF
jgi:hypothetical protein